MKITLHLIYPRATLAQDSLDRDSTQFRNRCHLLHPYVVLGYMSIGDPSTLRFVPRIGGHPVALYTTEVEQGHLVCDPPVLYIR
jgi:hypothetical protein